MHECTMLYCMYCCTGTALTSSRGGAVDHWNSELSLIVTSVHLQRLCSPTRTVVPSSAEITDRSHQRQHNDSAV
ncbi:uncharacterized protein YALI1_D11641g [Yarrowia lipolytica]|uniref:Uncharacterized protein n=1 Tax=Yarrowia lipolytica TaxID=4952 RepID=A0A1D8NDW4_YARLL|nr:hypothetical protein YALI1_D11641g [Yarrowia lipolytica]